MDINQTGNKQIWADVTYESNRVDVENWHRRISARYARLILTLFRRKLATTRNRRLYLEIRHELNIGSQVGNEPYAQTIYSFFIHLKAAK